MKRFLFIISAITLLSCASEKKTNLEIQTGEDLAGLRVATISGSCYDLDLTPRKDITLQRYGTPSDLLQALLCGKVDVVVHDEVVYDARTRKENGFKISGIDKQEFPTAFLFRKEDSELARTCSAVQRRMEEDGSMQALKDFWLSDRYAEAESYTHIPPETSGTPLRVATALSSAPLAFQVDDEWYGIEIDILRELAKELHRPLEIKLYDSGGSIMAVQTGMADVLCGCVFITPEREQEFLFSEPYHAYHPAYFVLDREAAWERPGLGTWLKNSFYKALVQENRWKFIARGLWETLKISLLSILLGSLLGIGLYFMAASRKKWIRTCASVYKAFIAGIPQLVLLLILFYVVFAKSGVPPDLIAVIAFAMFFATGAAGICKSSLDAIPNGQTEAALALGFTRAQSFFHIVFPQALRHGLPLFKSQCIGLLKGTSIVGYIAIQDLTRAGDLIRNRTFEAVVPLLVVTVIYFLLVWLIGLLLNLAAPKKKVL